MWLGAPMSQHPPIPFPEHMKNKLALRGWAKAHPNCAVTLELNFATGGRQRLFGGKVLCVANSDATRVPQVIEISMFCMSSVLLQNKYLPTPPESGPISRVCMYIDFSRFV